MKNESFKSSSLYARVLPFVLDQEIGSCIGDDAYFFGDGECVYFSRITSGQDCYETSGEAFSITTFSDRKTEQGVYITPRRNSIFSSNLEDVATLFSEGFNIYPVEEYQHTDIAVRTLSTKKIKTKSEIMNGSFRSGLALSSRFDSSYAFMAQPKGWPAPTNTLLAEFSNWMNGYNYSIEVLCATLDSSHGADGAYKVEVVEALNSYYGDSAEEEAGKMLDQFAAKHEENLMPV